jgi:2-C-methyl-D-erythritol 4-phosphate cytidylyltransferase|tara:strand:- start:3119 stop:3805 length:687 start_codon:yes stop_codon:yes gene_type:complete
MTKISAIIPSAGSGSRFGEVKQFKDLAGQPLIFHSINLFIRCSIIDEVVVVVQEKYVKPIYHDILSISAGKPIKSIAGGLNRQDSVQNGVLAADSESTLVCIHDAARPFVTEDLIITSVSACEKYDGAIVALPSLDTVKLSEGEKVKETIDRKKVWFAQTPQTFQKTKLIQALNMAKRRNLVATDESTLMEHMGFSIGLVEGHANNFKITTKEDWERAENLIKWSEQE